MPTIFYVSKLIIPLYQSLLYRTLWNQNIKNKNNCSPIRRKCLLLS